MTKTGAKAQVKPKAAKSKPKPRLKKHTRKLLDLVLGPLPVDNINRALGLELEAGMVVLTGAAQVHASNRHPHDYAKCAPHIAKIVTDPRYVGDDGRNAGKIEMVGMAHAIGSLILVAIDIVPNDIGQYVACSFYPISEKKAGCLQPYARGITTYDSSVFQPPSWRSRRRSALRPLLPALATQRDGSGVLPFFLGRRHSILDSADAYVDNELAELVGITGGFSPLGPRRMATTPLRHKPAQLP